MHDIQTLAISYRDRLESSPLESRSPSFAGFANMQADPRVLTPVPPAEKQDGWKVIALSMMVLFGISTSAFAISLLDDEESKTTHVYSVSEIEERVEDAGSMQPMEPALFPAFSTQVSEDSVSEGIEEIVTRPSVKIATRRKAKERSARSSIKANACDEVACLIDGGSACCQGVANTPYEVRAFEAPSRPYRLTRAQVMGPMQSIRGRVHACYERYGYEGVAKVDLVIEPSGKVRDVELSAGSLAFQKCVERHVRTLRFAELKQPFSVSFPYKF
jgi:hypothetical protein